MAAIRNAKREDRTALVSLLRRDERQDALDELRRIDEEGKLLGKPNTTKIVPFSATVTGFGEVQYGVTAVPIRDGMVKATYREIHLGDKSGYVRLDEN